MPTVSSPAEQRVVLNNVSWSTYLALVEDVNGQGGRMAYNKGVLEIMSPSPLHETMKKLIGRMVEAFTEELNIDMRSLSSTTFKREDAKRGIESDECYYIDHAASVRGKEEIDLTVDPSPDLAIEVDISRSSMNKLDIYSTLHVGEVWQYDGKALRILVLDANDDYVEVSQSQALPQYPVDEMLRILAEWRSLGETELIRAFRAWVREHIGGQLPN